MLEKTDVDGSPSSTKDVSLADVQRDWRVLDSPHFRVPSGVRLISHEPFTSIPEIEVEYVQPGRIAKLFRAVPWLFETLYAFQLLSIMDRNTVLVLGGSSRLWQPTGILNRLLCGGRRRILCWDIFVEVDRGWKRRIMRLALSGMSLSVLWSGPQVPAHARFLNLPEERFVFIPYKANHSKGPRYQFPTSNFIFSGGNGKRDYACLIDAVRDTDIPVVISTTAPEVKSGIERIPNVIVLSASEPAFAQLQAASRFVVLPMTHTGLKGGGEANFCNAMWHGKPIIAADSIAASEYILEGVTGHIVPSGDARLLRQRILELWDDAEKAETMGQAAMRHVEDHFTHVAFIRRLLRLALILGR